MGKKIFVCWLVIILLAGIGVSFAEQPAGENGGKGFSSKEIVTLFSEDFEEDFPGNWTVGDSNSDSGEDYWGVSDYKYHNGSKSCWCAQVGDTGGTPNSDTYYYDNNASAYMDINIDLTGYDSASMTFWYWLELEYDYDWYWGWYYYYDFLYINTSDGSSWTNQIEKYGYSAGWEEDTFDIPLDTVTIRFEFYSDYSNVFGDGNWEGAYIDDITITGTTTVTTGSISGKVMTDCAPLNNTIVTAYYACNGTEAGSDATDVNGDYVILNLPEGAYNVTASKEGYQTNTTTNVDVTAGQETQNINFTLTPIPSTTGTITGHVYVSGTTTGIQNANVSINASCYTLTDVNGKYTLSGVAQGTHTVTASATGYASSLADVSVTEGKTSFCNFTLTLLSETGNITGVVKDENNNTISGATVTADGHSDTTDANGSYAITGLSAGTYNVTASKSGYTSSTQTNVNVTAKNTTELNFVLSMSAEEQRGSISGTIKDKDGNPVIYATVTAYYANDTVAGTTNTNSTGGYKLSNLLPGTYTINISKAGFQEYSMSVTLGANQNLTSKNAELTTETTDGKDNGGETKGGAGIADYWWVAVVIAVIIVVVLVILKKGLPVGRRIPVPREEPVREEMPVREEFAPEKPVGKRFCIKCGREISKTAGFCPYCGYRFRK